MRIRTIKPEFWRSDDIAALSREDRLLFIGLWSYVDDNGVGIDDYRQIAADLFALEDDVKEVRDYVREGLATLSRGLLIDRYEVEGRAYIHIRTWKKHQRVDRPNKARYPTPPPDYRPPTSGNTGPSRNPRETLAKLSPSGTGEQGNRGTGESTSPPAASDVTPDRARDSGGGGELARAAELNATAHRPGAFRLVGEWAARNPGVTTAKRRELAAAVDRLLTQGADPRLIPAALEHAHGPQWRNPVKALPHAYDDIRRRAHPPPVLAATGTTGAVARIPTTTQRVHAALQHLDPEEP